MKDTCTATTQVGTAWFSWSVSAIVSAAARGLEEARYTWFAASTFTAIAFQPKCEDEAVPQPQGRVTVSTGWPRTRERPADRRFRTSGSASSRT